MSPSMDILISSNLERLLFVTLGAEKTRGYMEELARAGSYTLSSRDLALITRDFVGYSANEDNCAATVKKVYEEKNCLIDTHTAVAVYATECYINANKAERKVLTVSTASAYKFARDVYKSLTDNTVGDLEALSALCRYTGVAIPTPLSGLGEKKILHDGVIDKTEMEAETERFARA